MTPKGGPLDPKNANFSTIEFRAELAMLVIYILVVYEEYIIKSSKFNIRKIRGSGSPLGFLGAIFCIPQKLPLGSTARSHVFIGHSWARPDYTCHIPAPQTLPEGNWPWAMPRWRTAKLGRATPGVRLSTTSTTHCNIVKVA